MYDVTYQDRRDGQYWVAPVSRRDLYAAIDWLWANDYRFVSAIEIAQPQRSKRGKRNRKH